MPLFSASSLLTSSVSSSSVLSSTKFSHPAPEPAGKVAGSGRPGFRLGWRWSALLFALILPLLTAGCGDDASPDGAGDTGVLADGGTTGLEDGGTTLCDEPLELCGSTCVDLTGDPAHCGECDNQCEDDEECTHGQCHQSCPDGQVFCTTMCFDLMTSSGHCGACDKACAPGFICVDGECELECDQDEENCDGVCRNIFTDARNCGSCGHTCKAGQHCQEGICVLQCPYGYVICGESCVNLQNDPDNCGGCGSPCDGGQICAGGVCQTLCPDGMVDCDGFCVNLESDQNNCGRCGYTCEQGQVCGNGLCDVNCPEGQENCSGSCVNLDQNQLHCGGCGQPCQQGQLCHDGNCVLDCPSGLIVCGGTCVNTSSDARHCGECGHVCAPGKICESGECIISCPSEQIECNNQCYDPMIDNFHCGRCNNPCPYRTVCMEGVCRTDCGDSLFLCNDICVDLSSDRRHCGFCGNVCNGVDICEGGFCVFGCPGVYVDCNRECVNLQTDSNHCGWCDNQCTGTMRCIDGECISTVSGVSLEESSVTMAVGSEVTLIVNIEPFDATNREVVWESSQPHVASVEDGVVTGNGVGTTTISVTTVDGGYLAQCTVQVGMGVMGVEVTPEHLSLKPGQWGVLTATVLPVGASEAGVTWSSEDTEIATVDANGTVTAGSNIGSTQVFATTVEGGFEAFATITVSDVQVTGVVVEPVSSTLLLGETVQLQATVSPPNANNRTVIWHSTNGAVASVESSTGLVTGVGGGHAVVSAIALDGGHMASCQVTVVVPVAGVEIIESQLDLVKGQEYQLRGSVKPANATVKDLIWSSRDTQVAVVGQNGIVMGVSAGETHIDVTSLEGGFTDSCRVIVTVPVTGMVVEPSTLTMYPGDTVILDVHVAPLDADDPGFVWSLTDDTVVAFDGNTGALTGLKSGQSVLVATSNDGDYTATCQILVGIPVVKVLLDRDYVVLGPDKTVKLEATVLPHTATEREVIWSSSSPAQVTVDENGLVTGILPGGSAVITARAVNSVHFADCTVMVGHYEFTSHTFTNCGNSGRQGPQYTQCRNSYSTVPWTADARFYEVHSGIQLWKVPVTGNYRIEATGARGGDGGVSNEAGKGMRVEGEFRLEAGRNLKILVGQMGTSDGSFGGGGGGGTFVTQEDNTPLMVAGGGGGAGVAYSCNNRDAVMSTNGMAGNRSSTCAVAGAGGTEGRGGLVYSNTTSTGSGGGGLLGDGDYAHTITDGGLSFVNGGVGGTSCRGLNFGVGGFGGGGGGSRNTTSTSYRAGGGGGGYSGGGGGYASANGGGGGSFNRDPNGNFHAGSNENHGKVVITLLD